MRDGLPRQEPGWRAALALGWCYVAVFASLRGGGRGLGQGRRLIAPPGCGGPLHDLRGPWSPTPTPSKSRSELVFKSTSQGDPMETTQPLGG